MPAGRDEDALAESPHSAGRTAMDKVAEEWGVQKHPHGDVDHWLEHNPVESEEGPVVRPEPHVEEGHVEERGTGEAAHRRGADEDNLVQLPIGGEFGLDHTLTPREREERLRFAAAADAELREGEPETDEEG